MRFLVVSALLLACVAPASANCPNHCSGRGDCNSADLRCKCHQSIEQQDVWYAGGDCSLRTSFVRRRVVGVCWCSGHRSQDRLPSSFLPTPPSPPPPRTPSTLPGECPKGVAWADDATGVDSAHKGAVPGVTGVMCSNKGICDLSNGVCTCQVGYEGMACHRSKFVSWPFV